MTPPLSVVLSFLPASMLLIACQATTSHAAVGTSPPPLGSKATHDETPLSVEPSAGSNALSIAMLPELELGDALEESIRLQESPSSPAKPEHPSWTYRAWAGIVGRYVEDDNLTFQDGTFGTVELDWDDPSFGFGFDAERRFSKLLGLELAIGYTSADIDFNHSVGAGVQTDELGMIPIWAALNFHLLETERFDFYIGPELAYFWYLDDLSYDVPGVGTFDFSTDNEFPSFGFLLGVDFWLNETWGLNLAFRFQDADADSNHDLPIDPTFVTIGVARR